MNLIQKRTNDFYSISAEILKKCFSELENVFNTEDIIENKPRCFIKITGASENLKRSYFRSSNFLYEPGELADKISSETNKVVGSAFLVNKSKHFCLKRSDLIKGVEEIVSSSHDFIIIGVNILHEFPRDSILREGIYIYHHESAINNTFYILKKSHRPYIDHIDIQDNDKKNLKINSINNEVKCLDDKLKIYASITNYTSDVINLNILLYWKIYFPSNTEIIEIHVVDDYNDKETNDSNEI